MSLTLGAVDGVDGLLPAGVLLGSCGQTVVLVQVELEPHSQSVQLPLLGDGQSQPLHRPGAQTLQLLQEEVEEQTSYGLTGTGSCSFSRVGSPARR